VKKKQKQNKTNKILTFRAWAACEQNQTESHIQNETVSAKEAANLRTGIFFQTAKCSSQVHFGRNRLPVDIREASTMVVDRFRDPASDLLLKSMPFESN